jgi:acyl carrier protein
MASEEQWKIRFSTRELDALRSVGDLVRIIAAKTGGG